VDVGQRSGPSVQCLPRSHARLLCKVAASVRGAGFAGVLLRPDPIEGFFATPGNEPAPCRNSGSAGSPRGILRQILCCDARHVDCGYRSVGRVPRDAFRQKRGRR
jgi:hypothetical protein